MRPDTDAALRREPMSPLDAKRQIETAGAAPYNNTALQRERILSRLRQGLATQPLLTKECGCPSVTKRISELRRMGFAINTQWVEGVSPAGLMNVPALYNLDGDSERAQLSLTLE